MFKVFVSSVLIISIFSGCGPEPTPYELARDNSMAAMRAKMEARHKQRFAKTTDALYGKTTSGTKHEMQNDRLDDPTAYVYEDEVLSIEEEKLWKNEGISNTEYPKWAALGISADEVQGWKSLGISDAAIEVFKKAGYSSEKTKRYFNRQFTNRPSFYQQFGTPVYDFDTICQGVVKLQSAPFAYLEEKCLPYMKESHANEVLGHILDETKTKKGPLALEYLAELRRLADDNSKIQSGMEVSIEEFMEDEDIKNFTYLFPLLKTEPIDEEMNFIRDHKLPLEKVERYHSYKNPKYWKEKAEAEAAARKEAAHQEALLRAKTDRERKEEAIRVAKAKAIAKQKALQAQEDAAIALKNKMRRERIEKAEALCGEVIAPDQLSREAVFIDGKIVFTVEEHGNRMFGYGVQSVRDNRVYFIRDPKDMAKQSVGTEIVWKLQTMGRTEALSKSSDDEYNYDKKSKTKFTMALFMTECEL